MVSVVIPALNESGAIEETVRKTRETLEGAETISSHEIIVVDDGSTDGTGEKAAAAGARVIKNPHNIGYGRSLKIGISAAKNDTIVITDADGTYPIERIPDLVAEYGKGFDMVIGHRQGKNLDDSFTKKVLRWCLKLLVEYIAGRRIPDTNSGLRVFSKKTSAAYFHTISNAFSFTTSITLAYMLDLRFVSFVPIAYHKRVGKAKVDLTRDILRTLQYITDVILYYNPVKLYILLCLAISVPAIVLASYSISAADPRYLIGSGILLLIAFFCFLVGLVSLQIKQVLHAASRNKATGE